MYNANDTIVMLFHTRDAAEQFCSDLKGRGFNPDTYQIIGPNDLPGYGRGEHAVMDRSASSGLMNKLGSFFGFDDADRSKYNDLSDFLEAKGLSRSDAAYYENEVRSGSTMLIVKGGDRIEEIRGMSALGSKPRMDTDVVTPPASKDVDYRTHGRTAKDKDHIELREEVADVERHRAQTGEAEITKHVVTEHETIDVPRRREELVIERHSVEGRPVSGDLDISEDETIVVPLMEEDVTIEKHAQVYEEVDIGKREVTSIEREDVELRREELEVHENKETVDRDRDVLDRDRDLRDRNRRDRPAA